MALDPINIEVEVAEEEALIVELDYSVGNAGLAALIDIITANEPISALRVIRTDGTGARAADSSDMVQATSVLGISLMAVALPGAPISYIMAGTLSTPGAGWDIMIPIFFDSLGQLTQVPPLGGFSMIVGYPIDADTMEVRISQPVIIEEGN